MTIAIQQDERMHQLTINALFQTAATIRDIAGESPYTPTEKNNIAAFQLYSQGHAGLEDLQEVLVSGSLNDMACLIDTFILRNTSSANIKTAEETMEIMAARLARGDTFVKDDKLAERVQGIKDWFSEPSKAHCRMSLHVDHFPQLAETLADIGFADLFHKPERCNLDAPFTPNPLTVQHKKFE